MLSVCMHLRIITISQNQIHGNTMIPDVLVQCLTLSYAKLKEQSIPTQNEFHCGNEDCKTTCTCIIIMYMYALRLTAIAWLALLMILRKNSQCHNIIINMYTYAQNEKNLYGTINYTHMTIIQRQLDVHIHNVH